MKLKIEDLRKLPLRILTELKHIKEMEENNKKNLMIYRETEEEIKELYEYLEKLIENWNEAVKKIGSKLE